MPALNSAYAADAALVAAAEKEGQLVIYGDGFLGVAGQGLFGQVTRTSSHFGDRRPWMIYNRNVSEQTAGGR
jgi:hypothetical protein